MDRNLNLIGFPDADPPESGNTLDNVIKERENRDAREQQEQAALESGAAPTVRPEGSTVPEHQQGELNEAIADGRIAEDDSRVDGVGWNLKDIANEFGSAVKGGLRDTGSSILTAPERLGDMISGESAEEGYEGPDWDPLSGQNNPYTATWWGNFIRGGVHFGTMMVGTALAIKAAAVAGVPGAGIAALATGTKLGKVAKAGAAAKGLAATKAGQFVGNAAKVGWKGRLAQGAAKGAVVDLVSEYSQDDNFAGALKKNMGEHYPPFLDAIATNDADHPAMKTLKNVVEGMGIGMVFDSILMGGKWGMNKWKGNRAAQAEDAAMRIQGRTDSVEKQTKELGMEQLESPDFGGFKNKPIADVQQGNALSMPKDLNDAIDQKRRMVEAGEGSMDSMTTAAALRRGETISGMTGAQVKKLWTKQFGADNFDDFLKELKRQGQNPDQVLAEAGRDLSKFIDPHGNTRLDIGDEDFEKLLTNGVKQTMDADKTVMLSPAKLVMVDLVNAANTAALRDLVWAAREVSDVIDITDVDGPVDMIMDRLRFGMEEAKLTRWLWSEQGRRIQTPEGKAMSAEAFNRKLAKDLGAKKADLKESTKAATDAMVQLMMKAENKDTMDSMLEAFSMVPDARGLEDLYDYFDIQMKGGVLNGKKITGTAIRELQGVTINSLLSGPKTPLKAMMGTSTAIAAKPMAQALGATLQGDMASARSALAAYTAMRQAIPDAWKIFKSTLNSLWKNQVQTDVKGVKIQVDDQKWNAYVAQREFRKKNDPGSITTGDELAFLVSRMARAANNWSFFTYGSKLLQSTDTALSYVMAKMHTRQAVMQDMLSNQKGMPVIDMDLLAKNEQAMFDSIRDAQGNIKWDENAALKFAKEEVTLTRDIGGLAGGLEKAMNATPWAKPFFLFARTGVNGLDLTFKHMPLLNRLVDTERRLLGATVEMADAGDLADMGITNARELMNAKQLSSGRQMMGAAVVTGAAMMFLDGRISGNGPVNRQQRKLWMDQGWQPRSIKVGDVWMSYDSFEPFNTIMAMVADTGMYLGEQSIDDSVAEKNLFALSMVVAQGLTQKSYLNGMQQFVDLANASDYQVEKMLANLANNQLPLSSARNELGKLFNPYMKELNSGAFQQLRNRNQLTEFLAGDEGLPIKYDMLTGKPVREYDFMTRMFNMFSPVHFNLDYAPGKQLLFDAGYDMRLTAYTNPAKIDLSDYPELRSKYQMLIGKQNLEKQLAQLATRKNIQDSLAQMEKDKADGKYNIDPGTYDHNEQIARLIRRAQNRAWGQLAQDPEVIHLINSAKAAQAADANRRRGQFDLADTYRDKNQELLNMPIK